MQNYGTTLIVNNETHANNPHSILKKIFLDCYKKARAEKFFPTDDAQILEHYGYKVMVVEGSPLNIKITTAEDLVLARAILRIKRNV